MSDSVTKWHEMQQDNVIFESPDGGKTVKARPMNEPTFVAKLSQEEIKEAYKVLAYYEKNVILYAAKILNDEGTL